MPYCCSVIKQVNEARHAGCGTKGNFRIVAFPLYTDLLMEKNCANEPYKSPESASTGRPKFRTITDELERNLRSKYDSEEDILADLESALSALGAMQKLGCRVGTGVMSHHSPIVPTCNLTKKVVVPSRSSPSLQRSHTVESAMVSDSSATEQQETGGADSPSDQDEVMSYDGEGEQNYRHDYENDDEDGQTDQESPSPYQVPEAVELLWRPNKLWSVLKRLGWTKGGENGPYYRPMKQGESFACFSDVVSFCAMNVDHAGDGTARWCNRAANSAAICTNQKSFLMWGTLLTQLGVAGWKIEYYDTRLTGTLCSEAYLRPGVDPDDKGLVRNLHYFQDQETVKAFVCKYWAKPRVWLGHYKDVTGLKAVSSEKRRRSSEPDTIASKHMCTVKSKPKISERKPTKISVFFSMPWDKVWDRLTRRGKENGTASRRSAGPPVWTCKNEKGMGCVYFRPGCEGKIMASLKEGTHYFTSEEAVRQFCANYEDGDEFMEHGLPSNWAYLWDRLRDSGWLHLWKKTENAVDTEYEDWYLRPCNDAVGKYWDEQLEVRLGLRKKLHYFTTKDAVEDFLRINGDSSYMLETGDYTIPAISADGKKYSYNNEKAPLATPVGKTAPYVSITNHNVEKTGRLTPTPVKKKEVGKNPTTTACSKKKISNNSQQKVAPQESLLQLLDSPIPLVIHKSSSSQDPKTPMKSPKAAAQPNKNTRCILLGQGWHEEEGGKILVRPGCGTGNGWKLGVDYFYQRDRQHLLKTFLDDNPELLLTDNALADALRKKGWTSSFHPSMWVHPYGTVHLGEGTFDNLKMVECHIHCFPIVLCGENDEVGLLKWLRARDWEEDEAPSEDGSGMLRRGYQLLSRSEVYRLARINPAEVALPQMVEDDWNVSQNKKSPKLIDSPHSTSSLTSSQDFSPQKAAEFRLNACTPPHSSSADVKNSDMKKQQKGQPLQKPRKTLKFPPNSPRLSRSCRTTRSSGNTPVKGQPSCLLDSDMKNSPTMSIRNSSLNSSTIETMGMEGDFELITELLKSGWAKGNGDMWVSPGGQDALLNLKMVRLHFQLRSQSLALLRSANDALQLGYKRDNEKTDFVCTRREYQELKKYVLMSTNERKGGSLLLSGIAGSGKTLAASILEEELEMIKDKPSPVCLHLQGTASVSMKAAFQDLCDQLERKGGGTSEDIYTTSSEEHLMRELHLSPSSIHNTKVPMVIIVVDEIDCLDSNVLCLLFAWAHCDGSRLILIGVTNNVNLPNEPVMEFSRNRGWKSKHIVFPPYGKEALLKILQHRVNFAVEPKAIEFCAKWASNSGCGSARLALNLLLKAVGLAKADAEMCVHSERFSHPVRVLHTVTAVRAFNNAGLPTAENVGNLPTVAKITLCAAARTAAAARRRREPMGTTTLLHPDKDVEMESLLVLSEEEMENAVMKTMREKFSKIISRTEYRNALNVLQDHALIKKERGGRNRSGSTKLIGSPPRPTDNVQILVPVCLIKQGVSNEPICVKILT